jgi:pimeloyl-[acyl-carrier protein] methyl ester esterase
MNLHVETTGSGPGDLVLLHGWGMHGGVWDEALPLLAARFTVHVVDLPGHGHSAAVHAETFEEAVEQVAQVVPRRSLVCGWSLGGLVAQRLALRPDATRAVALVSSTPCFVQRHGWPHAMNAATVADFAAGLASDRDATLARFVRLNALNGAAGRDAVRAFTRRLQARGTPSGRGLGTALGWLRDVDLRADAARITVPVLLLHGTRDQIAPIGAARWLAGALPRARLEELGDAAHLPFFTHRDAFIAALETLHA